MEAPVEAKNFELHVNPNPRKCRLFVDNVEITNEVYGVEVSVEVGEVSQLTIYGFDLDHNGKFYIDPATGNSAKTFIIKGHFVAEADTRTPR